MTATPQKSALERAAFWATILATGIMCLALLMADAPYLHDFAEWLYQSQVLKLLLLNPGAVDGYSINPYPVPNALVVFLLAALSGVLPTIWAGKTFLYGLLLLWLLVIRRIANRYFETTSRASSAFLLLAVLSFATFFWYGFISYQVGLLLFAWFLSFDDTRVTPRTILAFSLALFFAHGMMFLVFSLYVAIRALTRRGLLGTLAALVPAGVLGAWFVLGRHAAKFSAPTADASWSGWSEALVYKAGYPAMLGPFKNLLQEDGSSLLEQLPGVYWVGFVTNFTVVAVMALFALVIFWKAAMSRGDRIGDVTQQDRNLLITAAVLGVLYAIAPYNFFGLFNPGGRLLLPLLLMVFIAGRRHLHRIARLLFWPLAVFTLFTCCSYLYLVQPQPGGYRIETVAPRFAQLPGDSVLAFNRALYANTRFDYFNYRIFAFARRFQHLDQQRYSGLGLRVGIIDWQKPGTDAGSR